MEKMIIPGPAVASPVALASVVGLNEAIVLQQIHYWATQTKSGIMHEGEKWVYNSFEEWHRDNFPFWSLSTIKRTFKKLEDAGLLLSVQIAPNPQDRTKSYRIDYARLYSLMEDGHSVNLTPVQEEDEVSKRDDDSDNTNTYNTNTASSVSRSLPLEWKMVSGEAITKADLMLEKERQQWDAAIGIATGVSNHNYYRDVAFAFMVARGVVIPQSKWKGQRKAIKSMLEGGVLPVHVTEATKELLAKGMTVVDLFSVEKTAFSLANPEPAEVGHKFIEGV